MRILGVDPGLNRCGWAIYEDGFLDLGTIKPPPRELKERLYTLSERFREVLEEFKPDLCVLELPGKWSTRLVAMQRPETLLHLGAALGVLLLACDGYETLTPVVDDVRQRLLGKKQASKQEVQQYLANKNLDLPRLKSGNVDADAADAMLIALYGCQAGDK